MRLIVLSLVVGMLSAFTYADVGDIKCRGLYRVVTPVDTRDELALPLVEVSKNKVTFNYEVFLKDRHFSISGNFLTGDVNFYQLWGKEIDGAYSEGIVSAASFDSEGRLSLSTLTTVAINDAKFPDVKEGTAVYRLECVKTLASSFPKQ